MQDLERIERFRTAGYGGAVSDALWALGIKNTVLSTRFKPLRQDMILVGRAFPVRVKTMIERGRNFDEVMKEWRSPDWEKQGGHPQKRMMRQLAASPPGSVLCFDVEDEFSAVFGEMSSQLAYAYGCRGMLLAGNCRDSRYLLKMPDFPMFSFGTTPNAFGGWIVSEINEPIKLPGHVTRHVEVNPGDFIFGDTDGVQVIPEAVVDEVLERVERTFEEENKEREQLAAGMPIDQVYEQFGVL